MTFLFQNMSTLLECFGADCYWVISVLTSILYELLFVPKNYTEGHYIKISQSSLGSFQVICMM